MNSAHEVDRGETGSDQPGFRLEDTIGFAVNRTAYLMRSRATRELASRGIDVTPEEWVILRRLAERDGRSQGEIADATIRDRTTVTRLIDGMVAKGLVHREPDPDDRRVVCAWLTRRGRRLQERLVEMFLELLREITADTDAEDLQTTIRTLKRIQVTLIEGEGGRS